MYFKKLWKKKFLHYIWLLRHPKESQMHFFNELTGYVLERVMEEHLKPIFERNLSIYTSCCFMLSTLYQTQPKKMLLDHFFPFFQMPRIEKLLKVVIPEYLFTSIVSMCNALRNHPHGREATKHLIYYLNDE